MPRYFFHVHDGCSETDDVGIELPNIDDLRRETIRFAGEVLSESTTDIRPGQDWRLDVVDQNGMILFRVDLTFTASAAVRGKLS